MSRPEFPPIPMRDDHLDARNYHFVEIDASDPRGSEALIDIGEHGVSVLPYYYVSDGSNAPYGQRIDGSLSHMWCRASLLPMLRSANQRLSAFGCELVVYDAYRPIATQRGLWAWALEKVRKDHPALSSTELEALTSQYSSDPRRFDPGDATTWPTHSSGASVDVMLRSLDTGKELDLGAAFDDLSAAAHTDQLEQALKRGLIGPDDAALLNRRLLYWAMMEAGFENYPSEFWHFDFGNQMYVLNSQAKNATLNRAWYGYCEPPT
ncbi:M15 family metallopeptidase [Gymnodinialimonas sp. 2305UL16-5]|uniref:M15 family metallopeptidase n=1 Tax=Gymnodinialimonas mytili TaxID=3126503 RepID=UPI00309815D6